MINLCFVIEHDVYLNASFFTLIVHSIALSPMRVIQRSLDQGEDSQYQHEEEGQVGGGFNVVATCTDVNDILYPCGLPETLVQARVTRITHRPLPSDNENDHAPEDPEQEIDEAGSGLEVTSEDKPGPEGPVPTNLRPRTLDEFPAPAAPPRQPKKFTGEQCCTRFMLFGSFLILIIGISLLAALLSKGKQFTDCLSGSGDCLIISGNIIRNLNTSASPCSDFWEFSCGGWRGSQDGEVLNARGYWSTQLEYELKSKTKLLGLIAKRDYDHSIVAEFKMKGFLESCMNGGSDFVDNTGAGPKDVAKLEEIIKNLGGWHALKSYAGNDTRDFRWVLQRLQTQHSVTPFFSFAVVQDPFDPIQNIVQITPSGLTLDHPESYTMDRKQQLGRIMKTFTEEIMLSMGASKYWANTCATDLYKFEENLASLMLNTTDGGHFKKITLKELTTTSGYIPWVSILALMFPSEGVSESTQVLVNSLDYFKRLTDVIILADKPTLNNYLISRLVYKYVPYMNKEYYFAYLGYKHEINGGKGEPEHNRWEFCLKETLQIFEPAMMYTILRESDQIHRNANIFKIQETFSKVNASFLESLDYMNLDQELKHWIKNRLRSMRIEIGTWPWNFQDLETRYRSLAVSSTDFFTNVLLAADLKIYFQGLKLGSKNNGSNPYPPYFLMDAFKIHCDSVANKIIVPELLVHDNNLFIDNGAVLFGSIGVWIAEAFADGFRTALKEYDRNITEGNISRMDRKSCFWWLVGGAHVPELKMKSQPSDVLAPAGVDIAFRALERSQKTDIQFTHLQDYNNAGIFLITYAQNKCFVTSREYEDMDTLTLNYLSKINTIRNAVRNTRAFEEAFHCTGSQFNQHKKCYK